MNDSNINIKEIKKILDKIRYKTNKRMNRVFSDFCEICFCSLHNIFYNTNIGNKIKEKYDNLEKCETRYLELIKDYEKDNIDKFAECFGILKLLFLKEKKDYLGKLYSEIGIGDNKLGQYFTPSHIASAMNQMVFDKEYIESCIEEKGYISIYEPTCGSGIFLIENINILEKDFGNEIFDRVKYKARDIDDLLIKICYTQLLLCNMNIYAECIVGNTLKKERREVYYTPELQKQFLIEKEKENKIEKIEKKYKNGQLDLFNQ
jgi:type I restriction-modification system DNA methylase subunit